MNISINDYRMMCAQREINRQRQIKTLCLPTYTFNEESTTSCVLQDHAVNMYAFSGNVSSVTMAFPTVDSNHVKDFLLDVTNSTTADAFIELSGLDSQFAVVVKEDDDLVEMTTVAPDEMARFYIT